MTTDDDVHHLPGNLALPLPETLEEALALWERAALIEGKSSRTTSERAALVRRMYAAGLDPMTAEVEEIYDWWCRTAESVATSSRATYRSQLRAWWRWLTETGRRADDPRDLLPAVRTPSGTPRPVTTEELHATLAAARTRQCRAYVTLAAWAGLRVHEIAKLRGDDFLRGRRLRVVGKGGEEWLLPLHDRVDALRDQWPRRGFWFASMAAASGHVHRCSVSTAISQAMRRAGVDARPHDLRHWYGTEMLRATGELGAVRLAMRHQRLSSTQVFTRVVDDAVVRAVTSLPT